MRIQGWNSNALLNDVTPDDAGCREHGTGKNTFGKRSKEEPEIRLELLKKIRGRIASGFYNNDTVIEDIGYGFAQALDHSI